MRSLSFATVLILGCVVACALAGSVVVNTPYGPIEGVATETALSFKVRFLWALVRYAWHVVPTWVMNLLTGKFAG